MPTHRISRALLADGLRDIERRQGERVLSVVIDPEDNSYYIVETTPGNPIETRTTA